ncbi:copper amine oxidase N-terminal domain-containing protein [Anaerobacillus alkaliphilus]|uniref:Copper amine oxidase N-terminal domain-containing protein n=1 Tax=Anaerobacillus alkaliphilus TaxID=1548597 RepID=A0A4Q0VX30_9BACI|nr:copper amine oxidase N-terminal domain-containing protein [Anaerobacillus alkaliphilus]RXJ02940.1 copper amine oxidase N-terminal domain-containing protein [Anaerobacillus alkaliphilus]
MVTKLKQTVVVLLVLLLALPSYVGANTQPIKIIVDGVPISSDQAPIIVDGRTLVPVRAIFEALDAKVSYVSATKQVIGTRDNTTVILTLGSNRAIVNNEVKILDVPAQTVNGRTLVPVRFVSEALGDDVKYNASRREVVITRKYSSNVTVKDVNNFGDGRDIEVSFNKAQNEALVDHYRIMMVKTSKANSFTLSNANQTSSNYYTYVAKEGKNIKRTLNSYTMDTDGAYIQSGVSYTAFILTVGRNGSVNTLERSSNSVTLNTSRTLPQITNLSVNDVSDYGDARDIEVDFTRLSDESYLLEYRAIIVRANEANSFNLTSAMELPSSNYTVIPRRGTNIKETLQFQTRDHQGRFIETNTAYRVFILAVGSPGSGYGSSLSRQSNEIRLSTNPEEIRVTGVEVRDAGDYGDGRDLEVSFSIPRNESRVSEYRIMVVPTNEAGNFNISRANNLTSNQYTVVGKTGFNIRTTLPSYASDVNGRQIESNRSYRVFVFSYGGAANSYYNSLSYSSNTVTLTENFQAIPVTNLQVSDVSNFSDGRDLQVSFNRVSDETMIQEYRIMVVKAAQANAFTLAIANNVSSNNYTYVAKTGSNITRTLSSTSTDAYGDLIREGVDYKVFVLSVSAGGNTANALSSASQTIRLTNNTVVDTVSNVVAEDIANAGDGSDMQVKFNKLPNESTLQEYRIMVVKTDQANSFNLIAANNVHSNNYTRVTKTGSNITQRLASTTRDIHGNLIRPSEPYKVFVLAVSNVSGDRNTLSQPSSEIILSNPGVDVATGITVFDIGNNGNGQDIEVNFLKAANETPISYYTVLVVRSHETANFTLDQANAVPVANYTRVDKTGSNLKITLPSTARDVRGNLITNGVAYNIFILSVADGTNATKNSLSAPSSSITLANN